jgi:DNA invertase Pin-like site-specific DNA recombinase
MSHATAAPIPILSTGPRAVGIARQSNSREEGESPKAQATRIQDACERDGMTLLWIAEELDVSGGTPLAKRKGLLRAVRAVENGEADVIVGAYFDRLIRSLRVQDELVSGVEAAGGKVLALDTGEISAGSAGQWLSGTLIGAVAEYHRRTTAERAGEAQASCVKDGRAPYDKVPPGYGKNSDGYTIVDADTRSAIVEAFRMRAHTEATISEIRTYLDGQGIVRSYHGVQSILSNPFYLGELHFGKLANLHAHVAIIDADTFRRVQKRMKSRGRRSPSERLLARLGVLYCGNCERAMVVGSIRRPDGTKFRTYRCGAPREDCDARPSISAEMIETYVVAEVKATIADITGRASAEASAIQARADADAAQATLNKAILNLASVADEPVAKGELERLRAERDAEEDRAQRLAAGANARVLSGQDFDSLTLAGRREIIADVLERVTVTRGRGLGRVTVHLRSEL